MKINLITLSHNQQIFISASQCSFSLVVKEVLPQLSSEYMYEKNQIVIGLFFIHASPKTVDTWLPFEVKRTLCSLLINKCVSTVTVHLSWLNSRGLGCSHQFSSLINCTLYQCKNRFSFLIVLCTLSLVLSFYLFASFGDCLFRQSTFCAQF